MPPFPAWLRQTARGVEIAVRVRPRSGQSRVAGAEGESLTVKLRAPPVEGEANHELLRLMSEILRIPRRDLALVSGLRGRTKRLLVTGATPEQVEARVRRVTDPEA